MTPWKHGAELYTLRGPLDLVQLHSLAVLVLLEPFQGHKRGSEVTNHLRQLHQFEHLR